MKKKDFESLKRGMAEAKAYGDGVGEGYVVHEPADTKLHSFCKAAARQVFKRTDW